VGRNHGPHQQSADGKPAAGGCRRQLEGAAGRLLLQSENQAADRGDIVVGGNLGASRTCGAALGGPPPGLVAAGFTVAAARLAAGLERAEATA
jgi:hypothetical protein